MLSIKSLIFCNITGAIKVREMALQIVKSAFTAHTAAVFCYYIISKGRCNTRQCVKNGCSGSDISAISECTLMFSACFPYDEMFYLLILRTYVKFS